MQKPSLGYLCALFKGGYFIGVRHLLYSGYPNLFCRYKVLGRQIPLRRHFSFYAGSTIASESMHPSSNAFEPSVIENSLQKGQVRYDDL